MTTKQAIEKVLTGRRKPMRVPEIIKAAVPLATGLKGKTPGQVVYSLLYSESKKPDGLVVQTGKGEFRLNPKRKKATAPAKAGKRS
jgi:HB1, ASXL, restriction endonuclease HTH domain